MKHRGYINMKVQGMDKALWVSVGIRLWITIYEYTCMEVSNLNNNYLRDLCNISTCL